MTAVNWEAAEHPRDLTGRFTDSPDGGWDPATPRPEKAPFTGDDVGKRVYHEQSGFGEVREVLKNGRVGVFLKNEVSSGVSYVAPEELTREADLKDYSGATTGHQDGDDKKMRVFGSTAFRGINRTLRARATGKQPKLGSYDDPKQIEEAIRDVDDVMSRSRTTGPVVAYRSMGTAKVFQKLKKGDVFRDSGYVSASMDPSVPAAFGSSAKSGQYAEILVPEGYPAYYGTGTLVNYELTLDRNSGFEVTGERTVGGARILTLKVVHDA